MSHYGTQTFDNETEGVSKAVVMFYFSSFKSLPAGSDRTPAFSDLGNLGKYYLNQKFIPNNH